MIEYYIQVARLCVMISLFILFGLIGTGVNANNTNELLVHLVSSNDTCIDVNMMATSNGCKDYSNTDTLWVIEEEIIVTNEVDGEYFIYENSINDYSETESFLLAFKIDIIFGSVMGSIDEPIADIGKLLQYIDE